MVVSAGGLHIKDELHAARQRRVSIRMALHRAVLETERAAGLASHRHQHHQVRDEIQQEADLLRRALAVLNGDD